jgi:hypothetical protein
VREGPESLFDELPKLELTFRGPMILWRGPSPYHFIEIPDIESGEISDVASLVTYGWGVIPVRVRIGETAWTTSLFPRKGAYLVPIKDAVRKAEQLELDDVIDVELIIEIPEWSATER